MNRTLTPELLKALDAKLREHHRGFAQLYPGSGSGRQPVHTAYAAAQLFHADSAPRLSAYALQALDEYAPDLPGRKLETGSTARDLSSGDGAVARAEAPGQTGREQRNGEATNGGWGCQAEFGGQRSKRGTGPDRLARWPRLPKHRSVDGEVVKERFVG